MSINMPGDLEENKQIIRKKIICIIYIMLTKV